MRVFNAATGDLRQVLAPSTDTILDVKFSPDGSLLATAGTDQRVMIFAAASGVRRSLFASHLDVVTAIAFSPDGGQLVSGSSDRTARVFDLKTGKLVTTYREHEAPIYAVAFDATGQQVVSAGRDKTVHNWKVAAAKRRDGVIRSKRDILELLIHGDRLFVAGADRRLREFGLTDAQQKRVYEPHPDWIYALALHEKTQRVATGCYDGSVLVWDLTSGALLKQFFATPLGPVTAEKAAAP